MVRTTCLVCISCFVSNHGRIVPNRIYAIRPYDLEDDRFQPEYDKSIKYLDVTARINLLNRRLDVLKDLNTILMDATQNHHAATLEWIVIILIIFWLAVAQ